MLEILSIIENYSGVLSLLLSVVAIGIAIWSSRSTSKSAEKQIGEIKNLAALQIETSMKQLEVEIQKVMTEVKKAGMERKEVDEIYKGAEQLGPGYRNIMMRKYQETKSHGELQIYSDCAHNLNEILKGLNELKKKLR